MFRILLAATALGGTALGVAPIAVADPPYQNCSQAHADGRYNIPKGDPAYSPKLDRDQDGYACEPYKGR
jgi:hypothetical protein